MPASLQLLAFVESRLRMVEHDHSARLDASEAHARLCKAQAAYAMSQAFFYAADLWVDRPPLVSEKALAYANEKWGEQAGRIWNLERADIRTLDRCRISESGLIYEHVFTGGMFKSFLDQELARGNGSLEAKPVAEFVYKNFQTAWIHRDEDKELRKQRWRSSRGSTLAHALAKYKACGIKLAARPHNAPAEIRQLELPADGCYPPFFNAVGECLRTFGSGITLIPRGRQNSATVRDSVLKAIPGIRQFVVLDRVMGTTLLAPAVSFEKTTDRAGMEPSADAWLELKSRLNGPEWGITYGGKRKPDTLCRYKRRLCDPFQITVDTQRTRAYEQCANALIQIWDDLRD